MKKLTVLLLLIINSFAFTQEFDRNVLFEMFTNTHCPLCTGAHSAFNSYLANGGDGYRVFLRALHRYDSSVLQRDVFALYLQHLGGRIRPAVRQRIRIKGLDDALFHKALAA